MKNTAAQNKKIVVAVAVLLVLPSVASIAQDRLKTMPGYEQYQRMSREIAGSVKMGSLAVKWVDGGKAFEYRKDGKTFRYDTTTRAATETTPSTPDAAESERGQGRRPQGGPARGRQFEAALSPDKKLKAFYRDRNLWLSDADGANEFAVTSEGSEKTRIKCGVASWVYGEELRAYTKTLNQAEDASL
jgi:dipeptidyl-peptidase-4